VDKIGRRGEIIILGMRGYRLGVHLHQHPMFVQHRCIIIVEIQKEWMIGGDLDRAPPFLLHERRHLDESIVEAEIQPALPLQFFLLFLDESEKLVPLMDVRDARLCFWQERLFSRDEQVLAEFLVVLMPEIPRQILQEELVVVLDLARHAGRFGRR
jgi:hypothetical protein